MSSVQHLREFVTERLTAAAEEILGVFQKTIVEYQEEIERQRRLLDVVLNPEIKLHRIELPRQNVCKEEEVVTDQQLCNQERNSSLDQEKPEPPQIKKEQEELCSSQDVEELVLRQETDTLMITPPYDVALKPQIKLRRIVPAELPQQHVYKEEEILTDQQLCNQEKNSGSLDQEEPEPVQIKKEQEELCSSQDGEQHVLRQETETFMLSSTNEESVHSEPEPNSDQQLLSHSSAVAVSQDQEGSQHVDSESTRTVEPEPKKKRYENTGNGTNVDNSATPETKCNNKGGKKSLECDFCGKSFKIKYLLNKHLRLHTGEKAYRCSICGEGYDEWPKFRMHMKTIHTIEKPYLCNTCGDRFYQMSHLTNHVKVHTNEETYIKTYGSPFRLYLNMRRAQSGETPHQHHCNS